MRGVSIGGIVDRIRRGATTLSINSAGNAVLSAGKFIFSAAASQIVGGATSFAIRNNSDSADNVLVLDDGTTTLRKYGAGILHSSAAGLLSSSAITNADTDASVHRPNLLTNGGFEIWQRATSFAGMANAAFAADRWQFFKGGTSTLTFARDTANADTALGSKYCAVLTYVHNSASLVYQQIGTETSHGLSGLAVSLSIRVKTSTASAVRVGIYNGTTTVYSSHHTGGGSYETLTVSTTVAAAATDVQARISLEVTCTAYIDNATFVVGAVAATFTPLTPSEDLARCLRYYQVFGGTDLFEQLGAGFANTTTTVLGFKDFSQKATTPTVTFTAAASAYLVDDGTGTTIACTAVAGSRPGLNSTQLTATVAAGLTAGMGTRLLSNNSVSSKLTFEANP